MLKRMDWQLWGILILGTVLRLLWLSDKPPHFDEGINGWFVDQLIRHGFYNYDPTNYHGPLHFYLIFIFKLLLGRNLWALRLPSVIMSVGSICLLSRYKEFFGKGPAYLAALFMAVSPAMVFYSRYAIHEADLLFFSLLAFYGYLRLREKNDTASLWCAGLGLAGMMVTKETYILHLGVFFIAIFSLKQYEKFFPSTSDFKNPKPQYSRKQLLRVCGVFVLILLVFYTGFYQDFDGIRKFFVGLVPWMKTGKEGFGHQKPFLYWTTTLMTRYEWIGVMGLILIFYFLRPSPKPVRFVALYGFGVWLAYSIVPYKTPWCILQILWPFFLVVAVIASGIWRSKYKWGAIVFVIVPLAHASSHTWNLNFVNPTDEKEPYVYVQTFKDVTKISRILDGAVNADPNRRHMQIQVLLNSHWPLPWMLGEFTKVSYLSRFVPTNPDGILILIDADQKLLLEGRLKKSYYVLPFRLRSAQEPSLAYFDAQIFGEFFGPDDTIFIPEPVASPLPGEGLIARFYDNAAWSGEPVLVKKVATPDFEWNQEERPLPAPFGVIFQGEILIPQSGKTEFFLSSDDGSELEIDGKKVVSNLGAHAMKEESALFYLKQGWHKIKIYYNDFGGGMILRLMWRLPNAEKVDIQPKQFKTGEVEKSE